MLYKQLSLAPSLVSGNELIGDTVQIIADDLRLRADSQDIVAGAPDQRCFPPSRHRAKRVPCMARDKTEGQMPSSLST